MMLKSTRTNLVKGMMGIFGCLGFLYSCFISTELSMMGVGMLFGDYQLYNSLMTTHGLAMLLGFMMPLSLGAMTNYFLPVFIGMPDLLFARLNNLSFWTYFLGMMFLLTSLYMEEGIGLGWTLYPTLSCVDFHSSTSVDVALLSVHLLGASSMMNSMNVMSTMLVGHLSFHSLTKLTLFMWSVLLTSMLLIMMLPVLAGGVTMMLLDSNLNTCFFDVLGGGDMMLFQHLFWFFGHPEVYVMMLPVFGLISTLMEMNSAKPVFSSLSMIYSMSSMSMLGYLVWAHHMFTTGIDVNSSAYFGSMTMIMGIPTAIKLFNWAYSLSMNYMNVYLEMKFMYMFMLMFLMGGMTGLILANVGMDMLLHDTYFVVAHFHYVLSLGAVVGSMSALMHFSNKWIGVEYNFCSVNAILYMLFMGSKFAPSFFSFILISKTWRIRDSPGEYFWFWVGGELFVNSFGEISGMGFFRGVDFSLTGGNSWVDFWVLS